MDDKAVPDVLVQRLHILAVQRGLTIKEMAQKSSVPKSSLEGYMRLKDAKRPGIDALVSIADAMGVSIDWLVGRSEGREVGEGERRRIALGMFQLVLEMLRDIDRAQASDTDPVVKDGKVGGRTIEDYTFMMMLHFLTKEQLFPELDFDSFRIINELLDETHK